MTYKNLPISTSIAPFAGTALIPILIIIVLSALQVQTFFYLVFALIAGVGLALSLLVLIANLYARKTGKYLDLASYGRPYHYLSPSMIQKYGLSSAGTKPQLIFGLVEFLAQVVFIGAMLAAVIFWTKIN